MGLAMIEWQRENWAGVIERLSPLSSNEEYADLARYYTVLSKCRLEYPAEEMLDTVRDEIRRSGPDHYILSTLGDQYVRLGLEDLAIKWYEKSLQLDPGYTQGQGRSTSLLSEST